MLAPPAAVAAYFAAKNDHSPEAAAAAFADHAVVHDEDRDIVGHAAIHAWCVDTIGRYKTQMAVTVVEFVDGVEVVTALVTGTFPGSPVTLRFRFVVDEERIVHLSIAP